MKKLFLLLAVIITFAISAAAQGRTVTGTVLSADNDEPLVGATVMGVGSKVGVTTDIDGNFTIALPASVKKLSVAYVGMNTKEVDIASSPMTIKLDNSNVLDEVITIAYGTAKRSSFTGSASVVDASQIEGIQVSNPVDALSGKVAGVQINNITGAPGASSPTIFIRGISSVNAGNSPLIVLDGAPYAGDLNTIPTQDIETMTVLKDAASNALYGARGANGVILITTKKGKGNAKVTLDAKWGQNSRMIKDYKVISDPGKYYEAYALAVGNLNDSNFGLGTMDHLTAVQKANDAILGNLNYMVYNVPEGESLIVDGYKLNPNATLGNIVNYNGQDYMLRPDNWTDAAYRNSLRQEYSLSVSQSTDLSSFYFSTNYLNNEGISPNSGFERFAFRLAADIQAKPWLKLGANAAYSHYYTRSLGSDDGASGSTGNVFAFANSLAPIYPLYIRDGEGNIMVDDNGIKLMDYGNEDNAGLTRPVLTGGNAVQANLLDVDKNTGNSFNGMAYAEIRFLNDFKFTSNNTYALDETRYNNVTNPYYGMYASSNGSVSVEHYRFSAYTLQQLLNWTRQFGDHNIAVLLGHENYIQEDCDVWASANNMLLPTNTELSGCINSGNNGSSITRYNNEGWFGRASYDYDGRYFGSASYRRDASSRFHPNHRWGSFWSAGAAWIISKEKFFDAPWVDMLKLKASYGEQGNDRIGNYRYINTYVIDNADGEPAARPNTMGNEKITWEKGGNFNAGVDFNFWNDRLGGSVEYFYRKTSDMLFSFPLPPSYGYTSYYANVGDMVNKGIEIDLHGDLYRSKNITVGMNLNMTHYKNKITYLNENSKSQVCDGVEGYSSGNFYFGEGESIYTYRIRKWAGIDPETGLNTWYKTVTNSDGTTSQVITSDYSSLNSANDYHLCGTALPKLQGGFGFDGNIYGFDFAINFNYQIGGKVLDSTYQSLMSSVQQTTSGNAIHEDVLKGWTPSNTKTNIGRWVYGDKYAGMTSDYFLTDASYLALQSVNVGYTIPKKLTKKLQIDRVRVYFTGDNLAIWSRRQGMDPRQGMAQGLSNGSRTQNISGESSSAYYSPVRVLSGGINVTF